MTFKKILVLIFLSASSVLVAQTEYYNQIKSTYDRLRSEEKHDSALVVAKEMNAWALQTETDTSLRYAVSFRYIGNCFSSLQEIDSALYYYNFSLKILDQQKRNLHPDYASCLNNLAVLYYEIGDYKAAEPYYQQALEIRKKALGEEHPDFASSLNNFGILYYTMGDYKSAEPYYKQALEIRKKTLGKEHPEYASSLNDLGVLYKTMGDYKAAELYYKQALEIYKQALGEEHADYASSLNNLGVLYKTMGDYRVAEPYFKQALEIKKKALGEEHPDYAASLGNLGNLFSDMGDFKRAEFYCKEALVIRRKALGEDHPDFASSLISLGNLYSDMGDYKAAEPCYKQALEIYKIVLGEEHPDFAGSLNSLGNLYSEMGDYKAAEPYYKQALEIRKKTLGKEHPEYASSLNDLGVLYKTMGDYKAAEPYYKQALEIRKKALGEEHPDYAASLGNLGNLYSDMGDYKAAELYYKQALEIRKKALGEEHPDYARILNNLGVLYKTMGNYKAAEPYYKQALEIYKQALGEEHPDYAMSLNNLGVLYKTMGDYKAAEPYYKKAHEIRKKKLGEVHPDYAMGLITLGNLYKTMGDYKAAEPFYLQALEILIKVLGEEHPDYAMSLNNLGILYKTIGDYNAAELYYKKALEIYKQALSKEHPDYAMSLNNLGILYSDICDYKAAELYYKKALSIYEKVLGEEHPNYASSLNNLGVLYSDMGDYKAAELYYKQAFLINLSALNINFSWLSAREKSAYWHQEKAFYSNINSFSVLAIDSIPATAELSYNVNLISKSLLFETTRELDNAIAQSSDGEMKTQFSAMKQLRKLYSKMQSEGSTNKEIMKRYKTQADSLDKILVNKLGEYAASKRKFEITWKDIKSNLTPSDAAIEFARYYDYKDSLFKYMALIVRPEYDYPKLVLLGEEDSIRYAVFSKDFAELYHLVWEEIDILLEGVERVYYSPAGELNNVAFQALCIQQDEDITLVNNSSPRGEKPIDNKVNTAKTCKILLMDKYELHQLTTTRYLADGTIQNKKNLVSSIILVGGVNFDEIPEQKPIPEINNSKYDIALEYNLNNKNQKQIEQGQRSSTEYGKKMKYLTGSKEEVDNIADLMNTASWQILTKINKNAGEYDLKKELEINAPGILHIATHGFAFPDEEKKKPKFIEMSQSNTYKVSEDPMVRCGLMLAGSNISWTGSSNIMLELTGEDGILTAAEVANIDLSNTKLVVLSACETGLGNIQGSEGTFGLKRGFKLAGVEQIIVSLWSVPDDETMELMTLFYKDLTTTLNPIISFEKAQKEMRYRYPQEPEKWAGFVLVR